MATKVAYVVASLLALTGCSQESSEVGASQSTGSATAKAVSSSPVGPSSITVPACEDYFAKVKACIDKKVPANQRAQFEQALDQSKASLATVRDKGVLAQACNAAEQQAKATYGAMACDL